MKICAKNNEVVINNTKKKIGAVYRYKAHGKLWIPQATNLSALDSSIPAKFLVILLTCSHLVKRMTKIINGFKWCTCSPKKLIIIEERGLIIPYIWSFIKGNPVHCRFRQLWCKFWVWFWYQWLNFTVTEILGQIHKKKVFFIK